MGYIYAIHAGEHQYRYVGQTRTEMQVRINAHWHHSKLRQTPIHHWLIKHPEAQWEVLEEVEPEGLNEAEMRWIAALRESGYALLNLTTGGSQGFSISDETRAKRSAASQQQVLSETHAEALHAGRDAWLATEEARAHLSEKARKQIADPNVQFGKPWTPELRERTMQGRIGVVTTLDEDKVRQIRTRRAAGERQKDLAAEFGVDPSVISKIVSRKRWAWVV